MKQLEVRPATEADVDEVRDLFITTYGEDYPFKQFYDIGWLKKAVYDDDTLFLIGRLEGQLVATASAVFTAGDYNDLVGELGRLVVHPEARGRKGAITIFAETVERAIPMVQFAFAEARTAHSASQKILERIGFAPLGFEPHKYTLDRRESVVMYGRLLGEAAKLRRNNPRVIPEITLLANHTLVSMGLEADSVVVDDDGYPCDGEVEIDEMHETGWSPLLRIERGRVKDREIFGNLSLSYGFFKIKTNESLYLLARRGGILVGGVGLTHDPVDSKVKLFELIALDDGVRGALLRAADRYAVEDLGAVYLEADISAYCPAIQQSLESLGFMPVAYCPAMVFENVERLDVVRMAKLTAPYFREDIPLTPDAAAVRDIVERSMEDRRVGDVVARAARETALFRNLDEGDMYHLARLGRTRELQAGETLMLRGQEGQSIAIVISGGARAMVGDEEVGRIGVGDTIGEMSLIEGAPRSADVVTSEKTTVAEFMIDELHRLLEDCPRLGLTVMRNMAAVLSKRLRRHAESYVG